MNNLLKKIYNEILIYDNEIVKNNMQVDNEINNLIEPYKMQLADDDMDKLKEMLSIVGMVGEQTGFENGVRFTLKILYFLLQN